MHSKMSIYSVLFVQKAVQAEEKFKKHQVAKQL